MRVVNDIDEEGGKDKDDVVEKDPQQTGHRIISRTNK